jgi:hypothetical protein
MGQLIDERLLSFAGNKRVVMCCPNCQNEWSRDVDSQFSKRHKEHEEEARSEMYKPEMERMGVYVEKFVIALKADHIKPEDF